MKLSSRLNVYYATFFLDIFVFLMGSFAANFITGPANFTWIGYISFALVISALYGWARWVLASEQRLKIISEKSLMQEITDSLIDFGVDQAYNMQRPEDKERRNRDARKSIDEAQSMRLAANSGASYLAVGLQRHWPNVRRRLAERVPFKVVLLDPFSAEKAVRNRVNLAGELFDAKLPLGDIIRQCNEFSDLEVRFASAGMTCSVFITNDVAYFDPYHLAPDGGRISNLFLCLRFRKMKIDTGLSNFELASRHFDQIWQQSIPLENWLEKYKGQLDQLPKFSPLEKL